MAKKLKLGVIKNAADAKKLTAKKKMREMLGQKEPVKEGADYNLYVVELDDEVRANYTFREANPDYVYGKPCVYVGITRKDPRERLRDHKEGRQPCWYVKEFSMGLKPELYKQYNPLTEVEAKQRRKYLADSLRCDGYSVWTFDGLHDG